MLMNHEFRLHATRKKEKELHKRYNRDKISVKNVESPTITMPKTLSTLQWYILMNDCTSLASDTYIINRNTKSSLVLKKICNINYKFLSSVFLASWNMTSLMCNLMIHYIRCGDIANQLIVKYLRCNIW